MIRAVLIVAVLAACAGPGVDHDPHELASQCDESGACVPVEWACLGEWPLPDYTDGLCNLASSPNTPTVVQCTNTLVYGGEQGCCKRPGAPGSTVYFFACP